MPTALDLARDASIERFRAWLLSRRVPATPQRLTIARVVLGATEPLAADAIIERLRAQGPAPGTATVYRTLDLLMECGLVTEEDRREGFRRFQPVRDDVSLEELLCTDCGDVLCMHEGALSGHTAAEAAKRGFVAVRERLVVYGLCARCVRAREQLHIAPSHLNGTTDR